MSRFHREVHRVCFLVVVLCIAIMAVMVSGCAQAGAHRPKLAEPKVLRPQPEQKAAHPVPGMTNPNDDFLLDPVQMTAPQGCLELRARTHNPGAC